MQTLKNEVGNLLPMTVTEGVTVNVLPNAHHEYMMTVSEVANGYGTTKYAIFKALHRNSAELVEGKHVVKGVDILSTHATRGIIQPNSFLLTKRGIVRLGFFIKSERAKLFRDWAEELVIEKVEQHRQQTLFDVPARQLPANRTRANRLTSDRLLSIMADVARIDDREVRLSIANKLMMGGIDHGN
jgi:hypothetical protein